ncbi:MAG: glycosyltransferase family 9 protein [Candidatus Celaenobacter antarcticus]|nr:glycosyltransferase family 9 protein [Candidatus Celaenobacter antarcticus]MDP8314373.1 glycosyltransferase family 9 protein [Candidatus Celaenobacter antarcticus]
MDVENIRKIDKWLGIPMCAIFTVLYKIRTLFKPSLKKPVQPRNILFVELSEMGSAILAYSVLQKTKELFPDSTIYFLIFEENKESVYITEAIPEENVLTIDCSNFSHFVFSTLSVLKIFHKIPIDTYIDMELFSRATSIISYLSGAHNRVGYYKFHMEGLYRGNFLTHRVTYNPHQHISYNFYNLLYSLVAPFKEYPKLKKHIEDIPYVPYIASSDEAKNNVFLKLQKENSEINENSKLIIFNPNAGILPIRAWPLQNYCELAKRLSGLENTFIVIMGVNDASRDAKIIQKESPNRIIDLTNKTTLREIIDLFNISDVLVTNDSGPAHFASLTPITNIVFFGPETPKLYGPLGDNCHALYTDFSCSPCVSAFNHRKTTCKDNQCVKAISVNTVYDLVMKNL